VVDHHPQRVPDVFCPDPYYQPPENAEPPTQDQVIFLSQFQELVQPIGKQKQENMSKLSPRRGYPPSYFPGFFPQKYCSTHN
jgi:hypothetical protein